MKIIKRPVVKICCISSVNEAMMACEHGASALGLVSAMPSGPGVISDDKIIEIVKTIPENVNVFLLTSETKAENIISQHRKFNTNTIQIVDEIDTKEYLTLKKELPGISLVQVVHVTDNSSIDYAIKVSGYVNAILLDSGNPGLKTKLLGGTGKVHNWEIAEKFARKLKSLFT